MKSTQLPLNRRVLLVDDNESIHADLRRILAEMPIESASVQRMEEILFEEEKQSALPLEFDLDSAYQGQEALELVKKSVAQGRPYALAFVDVRMPPGCDGVEKIGRASCRERGWR